MTKIVRYFFHLSRYLTVFFFIDVLHVPNCLQSNYCITVITNYYY